jgi:SAM-dependent methyltransferase
VLKTDAFDEAFGEGLASWLAGESPRVVLIDVSLPILEAARDRVPGVSLVCGDARDLPFKPAAFDGIVSLSTLDHFATREELERGLEELARVLRPRAAAVVTLDNPANPIVAIRNHLPGGWLRRVRLLPYPVGVTLGRDDLVSALERVGFTVRDVGAILHGPRVLAVAAAKVVDLLDNAALRRAFLRFAVAFERLGETPLRFRTGHFVAARAERR